MKFIVRMRVSEWGQVAEEMRGGSPLGERVSGFIEYALSLKDGKDEFANLIFEDTIEIALVEVIADHFGFKTKLFR